MRRDLPPRHRGSRSIFHPHCAVAVAAPAQAAAALARRQPLCQGATTPAAGTSTGIAPTSVVAAADRPCRRQPLQAVPLPTGCLPVGTEPVVSRPLRAGHGRPSADRWQQPLRRGHRRLPPPCVLALVAVGRPFVAELALTGHPCKGAGRGHAWLPLARASFAVKTQQECVERFYVIQSHHVQFKTNLFHENLISDTAVGKPTADWGREKNTKIDKIAKCERLILHREIVYPYIPDPDGEDEGRQASSSLAVSTR
ncbi:hypothetical protein GW17_00062051 [Ensete ventricosum]|nr:hypothetical protein GW17_00062051 [Ensete ventricosum]